MRVHQSTPDSPMREDRETETYVRVCDAVDPIATRALLLLPIAGAIIVPLDAILNPVSQNGGDTILALMHKCLEPGAAVLIPFSMKNNKEKRERESETPTREISCSTVVVYDPTNSIQTIRGWPGLHSTDLYFSMASVREIHDFVEKCGVLTHIDLRGFEHFERNWDHVHDRLPKACIRELVGSSPR